MPVTAADEAMHEPGPEPLWNESWYFDVADPDRELGVYLRLGRYPNRDETWLHLAVAGRDRPLVVLVDQGASLPVDGAAYEGAGWRAEVEAEPLGAWHLALAGEGRRFADPMAAAGDGPGEAVPVALDLTWDAVGEPYHYEVTTRYEVSCRVRGTLRVGDEELVIDAPGQRDHSWGVRDWWAFGWCWSAGALDDGSAFHVADIRFAGGSAGFGYVLAPGGTLTRAGSIVAEESLGADDVPTGARLAVVPDGVALSLEPVALVPVAFVADDGRAARMIRALCRYRADDGRTGAGWTEWNQLRDVPERS